MKDVTTTMKMMMNSGSRAPDSMPVMPLPSAPPAEDVVTIAVTSPVHGQDSAAAAAAAPQLNGQQTQTHGGHLKPRVNRVRSKSPSQKRKFDEGDNDGDGQGDGYRKQGRPRITAKGASKVQVEGVGDYQPSLQFYIGNTPGRADSDVIKKVLAKCSQPLLEDGPLEVEEIELLTIEDNPRTKCWRVVVPYKYMSVMENPELYPDGWRYRRFFGSRKAREKNKKPRTEENVVDEIMKEVEKEKEELLDRHKLEARSDGHNLSNDQEVGASGVAGTTS